jgi:nitroreductase
MGIERDDKLGRARAMLANYDFFDAPVGLIVTVHRLVDRNGWGHVGCFVQTLCLAAKAFGLDTCLQEAWSEQETIVRQTLDIDDDHVVWCGIALGYEDSNAPQNALQSERANLQDFVTLAKL